MPVVPFSVSHRCSFRGGSLHKGILGHYTTVLFERQQNIVTLTVNFLKIFDSGRENRRYAKRLEKNGGKFVSFRILFSKAKGGTIHYKHICPR